MCQPLLFSLVNLQIREACTHMRDNKRKTIGVESMEAKLLESSLWKRPAFQGPTDLMLEVAAPQSEDEE
jgi:hypothetical protein